MKKIKPMLTAIMLVSGFTACNSNNATSDEKKDVENLSHYVDSVDLANQDYTTANWSQIDNGYKERELKVEKNVAVLQEEDKQKADASKAKYAALKSKYEMKLKEKDEASKKPDYRTILRSNLFGEGKIGSDMKFQWVTAD